MIMAIVIDATAAVDSVTIHNPLSVSSVLDLALGKQHDTGSRLRAKAVGWLNEAMQRMYLERDWMCLKRSATLEVIDNAILKPDGFGRLLSIQGEGFLLTDKNRLTEEEIYRFTETNVTDPIPVGFDDNNENLVFYPGAGPTVSLRYIRRIPTYADNEETILDAKFKNLLARAVLSMVYEYEENGRTLPSLQFDEVEMARLKFEENRQQAIPQRSSRGYLRGLR